MEYENIHCRTSDTYDHIEMQPQSDTVDGKDKPGGNPRPECLTDIRHNSSLKKRFCNGVIFAVITLLVVTVVASIALYLSSKSNDVLSSGYCKTRTNVRNGKILRSTGSRHGDIIEIKCNENSTLNGSNIIICLSTGMWSEDTHCVPKDCGAFLLPQNMMAEFETHRTTVGSMISLFCQDGFSLSGNKIVICQGEGTWSESPQCEPVDCGTPRAITHAEPITLEKTVYNTSFTVACISGYVLVGSERVTCKMDGHWDDLPVCQIISCGMPVIPDHASITNITGTTFQSNVSMKCDEGFLIEGNPDINCRSSGNWTATPVCKRIDFCESSPCQNGTCVTNENNYTCNCSEGFVGLNCEKELTDCLDILNQGGNKSDGIYTIRTWKTHQIINVYCDMSTAEGGWTVFQYRFDKSVDFFRNFSEYERGFGDLKSEFWLGLKYIQEIAIQNLTHLRIDVEAENGTKAFETFDMFKLSTKPAYTLYLGNTISSLRISDINRFGRRHNGTSFSTFDNDVDLSTENCASAFEGGWWYNNCFGVDLNGRVIYYHGFIFNGHIKLSRMMIRRNLTLQ